MKTHWNGYWGGLICDVECFSPLVGHCASNLGTGFVCGLAAEDFGSSCCRVAGISIVRIGTNDRRTGFIMGFNTLRQFVGRNIILC